MAVCGDKVCEAKVCGGECDSLMPSICGDRELFFPELCEETMRVTACGTDALYTTVCDEEEGDANMSLSVTAVPSGAGLNETIHITYTLKNTGGVTINDLVLSSDVDEWTEAYLSAGESVTYSSVYAVTEADIVNGSITFDAEATGIADETTLERSASTTVSVASANPELALELASYELYYSTLSLRYRVTNTGNITLNTVALTIPLTGDTYTAYNLAPGGSFEYTATYTWADQEAYTLEVYASAVGSGSVGQTVTVTCISEITRED